MLPEGFGDLLPPRARVATQVTQDVLDTLHRHGYDAVDPPLVEYAENLRGAATEPRANDRRGTDLIRAVDPISQRTLALRPDMTVQVGRVATTALAGAPRPLRLSYAGQVLKLRAGQLNPERSQLQIGAELIGDDGVAAAGEIVAVALEALRRAGVADVTIDFTLPDLVDLMAAGPLPLTPEQRAKVRRELDMKDAGGLREAGGSAYLPLIEATGPFDAALARVRAFDATGALTSRLKGVAKLAEMVRGEAELTLDPTERHGFEYQTWFGFTIYADGFSGALGRGGSYRVGAAAQAEPAVGFSLYPSPLIARGFGAVDERRLFLPLGHDRAAAERLRDDGWRTVAALSAGETSDGEDAGALGCSHRLTADGPEAI